MSKKIDYFVLKNIKKKFLCPSCRKNNMAYIKRYDKWACEGCKYELSDSDFKNDYIFWFCDECGAFLNNQDNFNYESKSHACTNCGFENELTEDNIKGICKDCGKVLADPDAKYCADCRDKRIEKGKETLKKIGIAAAALAAGVIAAAASSSNNNGVSNSDGNYLPTDSGNDDVIDNRPTCKLCGGKLTCIDGCNWYRCDICGTKMRDLCNGEWLTEQEIFYPSRKKSGRRCVNCGEYLSGGQHVSQWSEGNSEGYTLCPRCNCPNYD